METKIENLTVENLQIKKLAKKLDIIPKEDKLSYNDVFDWLLKTKKIYFYVKFAPTFGKYTYIANDLETNNNWLQGVEIYHKLYNSYGDALIFGLITVLKKVLDNRQANAMDFFEKEMSKAE